MSIQDEIALKLPYEFNREMLARDLLAAREFNFGTHPLKYHDGSWQALNLIYAGGQTHYTHEGQLGFGNSPPAKTEVLDHCPYFDEVIESLPGEIIMARLSAIPAGGRVLRHYDPVESADMSHYRVHIPIITSSSVIFHLAFRRQKWMAGELWYGDFTFPHSIHNKGKDTRVHLIVDLKESDEIKKLFPESYFSESRREKRKQLRQRYKDYSWYATKLEKIIKKTT